MMHMRLFSFLKKHPILTSLFFAVFLIVVSFSLRIKSGKAIGVLPFGGQILDVTYCPCSFNLAITVGPPNGGVFTYEPGGSIIKAFYQIFRPGPWVLGWYSPGGVCLDFCTDCCYPLRSPTGTISEAGTSM